MANNTEGVELQNKVSDQLVNLMLKASLEKLKGDGDIIEKGRRFISMHNEELLVIMQLFQQEANRQKLELLDRLDKETERCQDGCWVSIEAERNKLKESKNE